MASISKVKNRSLSSHSCRKMESLCLFKGLFKLRMNNSSRKCWCTKHPFEGISPVYMTYSCITWGGFLIFVLKPERCFLFSQEGYFKTDYALRFFLETFLPPASLSVMLIFVFLATTSNTVKKCGLHASVTKYAVFVCFLSRPFILHFCSYPWNVWTALLGKLSNSMNSMLSSF